MKKIYLYNLYAIFLFLFYAVVVQADTTQIEISDFNKGRVKLSSDGFKKLMERAKSGEADALYMVSVCYLMGEWCSVKRDEDKSRNWLDRAVKAGQGDALFLYGMDFQFGRKGRKIDINKAINYYERSSENGYKGFHVALIKALAERGKQSDIRKINNIIEALIKLDKNKGYDEAVRVYHSVLFEKSTIVKNDVSRLYFDEFKRWHRKSLDAGVKGNCHKIGSFYYRGVFVKKDEIMMNGWYHYCRKIGDSSYILKGRVDEAKFSEDMKQKINARVKWIEDNFPDVY